MVKVWGTVYSGFCPPPVSGHVPFSIVTTWGAWGNALSHKLEMGKAFLCVLAHFNHCGHLYSLRLQVANEYTGIGWKYWSMLVLRGERNKAIATRMAISKLVDGFITWIIHKNYRWWRLCVMRSGTQQIKFEDMKVIRFRQYNTRSVAVIWANWHVSQFAHRSINATAIDVWNHIGHKVKANERKILIRLMTSK